MILGKRMAVQRLVYFGRMQGLRGFRSKPRRSKMYRQQTSKGRSHERDEESKANAQEKSQSTPRFGPFQGMEPHSFLGGIGHALFLSTAGFLYGCSSLVILPLRGLAQDGPRGLALGLVEGTKTFVASPLLAVAVGVVKIFQGALNSKRRLMGESLDHLHNTLEESDETENTRDTKLPKDMKLYDILQVSWDAEQETIKRAYYKQAARFHPDTHPDDPEALRKFKEVTAAYEVLGDSTARKVYDRLGTSVEGDLSSNTLSEDPIDMFAGMLGMNRLEPWIGKPLFAYSLVDVELGSEEMERKEQQRIEEISERLAERVDVRELDENKIRRELYAFEETSPFAAQTFNRLADAYERALDRQGLMFGAWDDARRKVLANVRFLRLLRELSQCKEVLEEAEKKREGVKQAKAEMMSRLFELSASDFEQAVYSAVLELLEDEDEELVSRRRRHIRRLAALYRDVSPSRSLDSWY